MQNSYGQVYLYFMRKAHDHRGPEEHLQPSIDINKQDFATLAFILLEWTRGEDWQPLIFNKGKGPRAVLGTEAAQIVFRQQEL